MSAGVSMRANRRHFDLIPANDIIPYARVPRPAAPRPFEPRPTGERLCRANSLDPLNLG